MPLEYFSARSKELGEEKVVGTLSELPLMGPAWGTLLGIVMNMVPRSDLGMVAYGYGGGGSSYHYYSSEQPKAPGKDDAVPGARNARRAADPQTRRLPRVEPTAAAARDKGIPIISDFS